MISCQQSGNNLDYHFAGAGKMVELVSRSVRELEDYHLSRFACYLIAQNGDPRKSESYRSVRQPFGAMPEQIPPAEHINEVEKRTKNTLPVLELDEKDAKGLVGREE